jgi:hypothetical protein
MVTDIGSESILEVDGDVRSRWTLKKNIKQILEEGLFSY